MKKSVSLIMCLLSGKAILASQADALQNGLTKETFSSSVRKLYRSGGKGALMLALRKLQQELTIEALNPDQTKTNPLQVAYQFKDTDLFEFLLRLGANPKASISQEATLWEDLKNSEQYSHAMVFHAKRETIEPLVIRALYATPEQLTTVISELRNLCQLTRQDAENPDAAPSGSEGHDENAAVREEQDANQQDVANGVLPVEELDERQQLSSKDVIEVLEWLLQEKLKESQTIANVIADFKDEKHHEVVSSGYSGTKLVGAAAGALVLGIGLGWLLKEHSE